MFLVKDDRMDGKGKVSATWVAVIVCVVLGVLYTFSSLLFFVDLHIVNKPSSHHVNNRSSFVVTHTTQCNNGTGLKLLAAYQILSLPFSRTTLTTANPHYSALV